MTALMGTPHSRRRASAIALQSIVNVPGSMSTKTGAAPASSYSFQDISKIRSTERKPRKTWVKVLAAPVVYPLELIAVTAFLAACGATKILGQGCLD